MSWQKAVGYSVAGVFALFAGNAIYQATKAEPVPPTPPLTFKLDDVLMVRLSDPRIVHSPTTTMDFRTLPMRVIALQSPQGPDFIMVKKEKTFNDPSEFIVSVPHDRRRIRYQHLRIR